MLKAILIGLGILAAVACAAATPQPMATVGAPAATASLAATPAAVPLATPTPTPTTTPTPTPTLPPVPTPTLTPTTMPTPTATPDPRVSVAMRDETLHNMEQFLRVSLPASNIQLVLVEPNGLTGAPEAAGEPRYGLVNLGYGRTLAVMADVTATNEDFQRQREGGSWGTLYVGTTPDGSLADPVSRPFSNCCADVGATLSLEYDGEEARLPLRVSANITAQYQPWSEAEERRLRELEEREDWQAVDAMHRSREVVSFGMYAEIRNESLRAGELLDTGELFMLQPTSAARFDGLHALRVLQDLDHDGLFEQDVIGEVQQASQAVLIGIDTAWEVHSVSPSGRTVQVVPKRTGVLAGRAVAFGGGDPIAGATVKVEPGGFEAQTTEDGSFRLEVYEGILWKLLVTKDGFIPYTVRFYPNRQFDHDQDQERILVRAGRETSHTVELFETPDDTSSPGTVLLSERGSFYGALGLAFRDQLLGDFVFETWLAGFPEGDRFRGEVCACKEGQRGLVDLGDQGSKPLEDIPVVPFGFTRDYFELREGSVYLVKAREGFESHFLVFRVLSMTEYGIEISYLFR